MRPAVCLRIASALTLVHGLTHTIGGVFGKTDPGPMQAAVSAMQADTFPVLGITRSFWGFHLGFGLAITMFLTMEAVVFWQFSLLTQSEVARLRPVIATFTAGYVVFAAISYRFFFWPPVVAELLIAGCLGMTFFASSDRAIAGDQPRRMAA